MSEFIGALSYNTFRLFHQHGVSADCLLKHALILFDGISYLQTMSFEEPYSPVECAAIMAAHAQGRSQDLLMASPDFRKAFIGIRPVAESWQRSDGVQVEAARLMNGLDTNLVREAGLTDATDAVPALCDIAHLAALDRYSEDCCAGIFSEFHRRMLSILPGEGTGRQWRFPKADISKLDGLPDFGQLSWDQVLDLRRDRFIRDFRRKLFKDLQGVSSRDEIVHLDDEMKRGFWSLTKATRPDLRREVASAVASNIPFLPVNPFSLFAALFAINYQRQLRSEFGWLFFLERVQRVEGLNADGGEARLMT